MKRALEMPPAPAQQSNRDAHIVRSIADLREAAWITADEAVRYLGLGSLSALYRAIREHRLPYGRVGRQYRFNPTKLDAWVESRGLGVREPWTLMKASAR